MSHVATITIDHTKVAADLTDFPVLVIANGDAGWAELYNVAAEAGGDIRVFKSDGVTELPREIVSFSVSAETGEIHIKYTGTLSSTVDTDIQIHADGVSGDYSVSATYGRNAVWSDYWAVYHLQDATTDAVDSTGGGATATKNGTPTSVTGAFGGGTAGKAADLDGTTEWYRTANNALNVGSGGTSLQVSMSIWWKQSITTYKVPLSIDPGDTAQRYFIQIQTQNGDAFAESGGNTGASIGATYTASLNNSAWHLHRWNHSNSGNVAGELYVDGVSRATATGTAAFDWPAFLDVVTIGATDGWSDATIYHRFQGSLDEARLRKTIVSDQWDTTEYNNQNSPSTFYSVAAEAGSTPQTVTATGRVSAILALLKRYKRTQTANGRASATVATKKSLKRTLTASIRGSAVVQKASVTFITVTAAIRAASTITDKSINAIAANANARVQAILRRLVRKNFTATGRVSATVTARKTRYVALTASIRGTSTVTNAKRFYETVTAIVRGATTVSRGDIFRNIILTATIGVKARLGEYFYKRKYQEEEEEDYKRKFIP